MHKSRESRLYKILAEYLEREDAGCAPDPAEMVEHYPDVAMELQGFLADQIWLERLVGRQLQGTH
jgi:hypothetical protein